MEIIINPPVERWESLCERNVPDDSSIEAVVKSVIEDVCRYGDEALRKYTQRFDGYSGANFIVTEEEIDAACKKVDPTVREAIRKAAKNISAFHKAQLPCNVEVETMPGVRCIQKSVPINRVGLYIPGGRAPLFSTILMLAIPAKIAGCEDVVLCTPAHADSDICPEILFTAKLCGVKTIYRLGGAQAIAAMAYGTKTVAKVDKIFGPGNRFVTKAKQMVNRDVAIDMPAGPSEVMVVCDESCNPLFVASDMLSQAEHGPDSQAIAVCSTKEIAEEVMKNVVSLAELLSHKDSVAGSLSHSRIIVFDNKSDILNFCNDYAPEHLIVSMKNPWKICDNITSAGSVFVGNYSPESAGDYASGTNHTLPTSGWAKSYSGVNIDSFMHKITFQQLTREGLEGISDVVTSMARAEGLDAHALAVKVRINPENYGLQSK